MLQSHCTLAYLQKASAQAVAAKPKVQGYSNDPTAASDEYGHLMAVRAVAVRFEEKCGKRKM
jgi:hypothetical protein